jgi:hypothetical protein
MIPDTYCTTLGPNSGYQCPSGMKCVEIHLNKSQRGFNGFDEISITYLHKYQSVNTHS